MSLHLDLTFLFLNSFFVFGIFYCFAFQAEHFNGKWTYLKGESNILGLVHFNLRKVASEYICRPIFGCVVCMASVWGTIFYITFGTDLNFETWLVHLVALAGANSLLKQWL